jgi:hypothetical protein
MDNIDIGCRTYWDGEDLIVVMPKACGNSFRLIGAATIPSGCGDDPQFEYSYKGVSKAPEEKKELLKANFIVTEKWTVECPYCMYEQEAPFNHQNPMEPRALTCRDCYKDFILTYERED